MLKLQKWASYATCAPVVRQGWLRHWSKTSTYGINTKKSIVFANAKGNPDICQKLSFNQLTENTSKNYYNICVDSAYFNFLYSLLERV